MLISVIWGLKVEFGLWDNFSHVADSPFIPLLRYILFSEKTGTPVSTPKGVRLAETLRNREIVMVRDSENMACHKKLEESRLFSLNQTKEKMFAFFYMK